QKSGKRRLATYRLSTQHVAKTWPFPISPLVWFLQGLTPTSELAEGGDEFAGHGLELVICQSDEMYPFSDIPQDFVNANREHHQLAVSQICRETRQKGHRLAEQ
uniref:Uncharacterized protein n=1 Tax=Pelusios castaneus TaxID=367368 RepID=A0A8C8RJC8_9SAUR